MVVSFLSKKSTGPDRYFYTKLEAPESRVRGTTPHDFRDKRWAKTLYVFWSRATFSLQRTLIVTTEGCSAQFVYPF